MRLIHHHKVAFRCGALPVEKDHTRNETRKGHVRRPTRRSTSKYHDRVQEKREKDHESVIEVLEASSSFEDPELETASQSSGSLAEDLRSQNFSRAIRTARKMISAKEDIDVAFLDPLLQGLSVRNRFREAMNFYDMLEEQTSLLSYRTFHLLIQAALKNQAYNYAIQLYKDMLDCEYKLNVVTYGMLLFGLLRGKRKGSSNPYRAYEIWTEILQTNKALNADIFRAGCWACVELGKMEEAEALIPVMRHKGYRPDLRFYNILIKGYTLSKNMKAALDCFEKMKESGIRPRRDTYNTLIQGFVIDNQMEKAEKMLRHAMEQKIQPDVRTYTSLIKGYLKQQRDSDADRLFEEMIARGVRANEVTFGVMMDRHVRQGRLDLARKALDAMAAKGLKPNVIIYNTLLKGYASAPHSKSHIIDLLEEMKQKQINPGEDTINTLLSKMLEMPGPEGFEEVFQNMSRLKFLPDAVSYSYLLKAAYKEGNVEKCCRLFEEMKASENVEVDLVCWNLMVSIMARSGEMERAEIFLNGAIDFAKQKSLPIPVEAFGAILFGYVKVQKDLPKAIETFRWFCKLGGQPDTAMLEFLLEACIRQHDTKHALKILRATKWLHKDMDLKKYHRLLIQQEKENAFAENDDKQNRLAFERLKFWLGMPNSYYSSDWP